MNNDEYNILATGDYATYKGHEYFAQDLAGRVRLLTDKNPLPSEFQPSKKDWIRGEAIVPASAVQRFRRVRTTCHWRGHPFEVGIIVGFVANVFYLGKDFDEVSSLPGMIRPDKYEVQGEVPVEELADIQEYAEDVPLRVERQK